MVKRYYLHNALRGITVIHLNNGDEAIYLNCDFTKREDALTSLGMKLFKVMDVPFKKLKLFVIGNKEWCDVTDELKWVIRTELPRNMLRSVLECSISHITLEDNFLLQELSFSEEESPWVHDTDVGYLLRLDAVKRPVLRLKRYGISRPMRELIFRIMQQADISMIHFSSAGGKVEGAQIFEW